MGHICSREDHGSICLPGNRSYAFLRCRQLAGAGLCADSVGGGSAASFGSLLGAGNTAPSARHFLPHEIYRDGHSRAVGGQLDLPHQIYSSSVTWRDGRLGGDRDHCAVAVRSSSRHDESAGCVRSPWRHGAEPMPGSCSFYSVPCYESFPTTRFSIQIPDLGGALLCPHVLRVQTDVRAEGVGADDGSWSDDPFGADYEVQSDSDWWPDSGEEGWYV